MEQHLPSEYASRLWRTIIEFDLLEAGDRILIGLSGGKDSMFLAYALALLRRHSPRPFELAAFTLDPLFTDDFDTAILADFCRQLEMPFYTRQVNVAKIIETQGGKNACFTCAFFRRGVINNFAVEHGFNKVALAHHHDDAVETFYMGLLYSGQLKTFAPKTFLSRKGLTVIRPLVYFREDELRRTPALHGYEPVASPCPRNGKTKRQEIKELLAAMEQQNPMFYENLAAGMRAAGNAELWPPVPSRSQLKTKHDAFWHGQSKGRE